MIPTNSLVNQLEAYIKTSAQPLIQLVDTVQEIQQLFSVGEQVRAQVTGELPNGRFAVLVKDQLLDLNLPRNTQPGEEFDMRVISNSPRLAFLLPREALLGATTLTPQSSDIQSAQVELSNTAQFLGELLSEASAKPESAQLAALQNAEPLMAGEEIDTAKLANTLQTAFANSGLFYESHLADWVQGKISLQALMADPQAKLASGSAPQDSAADESATSTLARSPSAAAEVAAQTQSAPEVARQSGAPEQAANAVRTAANAVVESEQKASVANTETSTGVINRTLSDMPTVVRDVVQQQLQVLDQRPVVWMGQAWSGQPMKWEIEEDRSNRTADGAEAPTSWNTRLHLDLPTLGAVDVAINLSGRKKVGVSFTVSQSGTANLIQRQGDRLRNQLESAGLELIGQQVAVADTE